jgi:hypothetical protein
MERPEARYRLYIDESGDAQTVDITDPRNRYLGLTGVVLRVEAHRTELTLELDALKTAHFPSHRPNRPVVLVRSQIVRATGPFAPLADAGNRAAWEADALDTIRRWTSDPITIVIDKLRCQEKYGEGDEDAYFRALRFILERYRAMLYYRGGRGDVLVESRGKVEDSRLKKTYERLYNHGTGYQSADDMQAVLTSKELKFARKSANIAGHQIADLVANPARRSLLQEFRAEPPMPGTFSQRVIETIRPSYHWANRVIFPKKD